ncbi:MAG: hypothetical protein K6T94_15610 [Paenibacillus sp.]|nr:hypothetical protein [Paenibacillus sp.]
MTKYPIIISESDALHSIRAIRHIDQEFVHEGNRVTRIHTAWKLKHGPIMIHEYTSYNQPSSTICFFDTIDDYIEVFKDIDWIMRAPLITN